MIHHVPGKPQSWGTGRLDKGILLSDISSQAALWKKVALCVQREPRHLSQSWQHIRKRHHKLQTGTHQQEKRKELLVCWRINLGWPQGAKGHRGGWFPWAYGWNWNFCRPSCPGAVWGSAGPRLSECMWFQRAKTSSFMWDFRCSILSTEVSKLKCLAPK